MAENSEYIKLVISVVLDFPILILYLTAMLE